MRTSKQHEEQQRRQHGQDGAEHALETEVGGDDDDDELLGLPAYRRYLFDMQAPLVSKAVAFTQRSICVEEDD